MLPERVRRLPVRPVLPVRPEDAEPTADDVLGAAEAGAGAMPQVSQYPPSIVPPQPGRSHLIAVVVMGPCPSAH
jgi:hypothetical protein